MKHITDHQDFAQAVNLLHRLEDELARCEAEHASATKRLSLENVNALPQMPDNVDAAVQLLDGKTATAFNVGPFDIARATELELRQRIALLQPAVRDQAQAVELCRERARAAEVNASPEVKELRAKWEKVTAGMATFARMEDDFLNRLAANGYGRSEPIVTGPGWLVRGRMLEVVR